MKLLNNTVKNNRNNGIVFYNLYRNNFLEKSNKEC